jgi:hypothetical protein
MSWMFFVGFEAFLGASPFCWWYRSIFQEKNDSFFAIIFKFVPVIHSHEKIWIQILRQQIPKFGFAIGKLKKGSVCFFGCAYLHFEMSVR